MIIHKIYNNNVVLTEEAGQEVIVMGRGLAFAKKVGDELDETAIEKRYALSQESQKLFADLPVELLEIADKAISYAKCQLELPLKDKAFLSLADHMHGVEQRVHDGFFMKNFLMWDIKRFFPKEYQAGLYAQELLSRYLEIELPDDEAGFMALTLVNSELHQGASNARDLTQLMEEILTIVKYSLEIPLEEDDIYVQRFITHLKFFCERVLVGRTHRDLEDTEMFELLKIKYPKAYATTEKISHHLEQTRQYRISDDEQLYLTIHLSRIKKSS
ncbi:PRD domain-containing protein [Streptococcus mitis]|uniref:PRD domain-containing protein n=1 Tax=Streptococcus mitis TaxID=28037 RepID=UPI001CBFD2EA|nr:PRD domain-containing protein [Streptococcus mitis]MBZ2099199.1 PRD domain-containing protein [Streptococcus mitis]MBZ2104944.1 PRD domain-containing protein [Streptococcus mitis]MBZ2108480.1 PRD domain-containing protein [Streptococcus mitis]